MRNDSTLCGICTSPGLISHMTTDARTAASSQPPAASRQPTTTTTTTTGRQPASQRASEEQTGSRRTMRCDATRRGAMRCRHVTRGEQVPIRTLTLTLALALALALAPAPALALTLNAMCCRSGQNRSPSRPTATLALSPSLSLSHSVLLRQSSPASRRIRSAPPVGRRPASPDYHPNLVHGAALPCPALPGPRLSCLSCLSVWLAGWLSWRAPAGLAKDGGGSSSSTSMAAGHVRTR